MAETALTRLARFVAEDPLEADAATFEGTAVCCKVLQ